MKELSIEEKAKAYDEAIERAKFYKENTDSVGAKDVSTVIEGIFPALKECEDERIKNEIIAFLEQSIHRGGGTPIPEEQEVKWLAWLEKQGKNKPVISDDALREGIAHFGITQYQIDNWLKKYVDIEKHSEQKPTEKTDVLMSLDEAIEHCKKKSCGNNACALEHKQLEKWLTELKELKEQKHNDKIKLKFKIGDKVINDGKVCTIKIVNEDNYIVNNGERDVQVHFSYTKDWELVKQDPTWSEEDEKTLNTTISFLSEYVAKGYENAVMCTDWIKSLKERIQPQTQNKWKESLVTADLENSLCDIQDGFSDTSYEYRKLGEAVEFIRCTDSRLHWKPSEEQMEAFYTYLYHPQHINNSDDERIRLVESLYQDLKKLRG